jgi:uncharacterized membrane protein
MEDWFTYALLSGFFAWFYSFSSKISAEKDHSSFLITAYSMLSCAIVSLIAYFFTSQSFNNLGLLFLISVINGLFYFIAIILRIESLKNITSIVYFPIYKMLWPILMLVIWILFFSEKFNYFELFWVFIWITVPLLLIWEKNNKLQKNLTKWISLLVISTLFATLSSATWKIIMVNNLNILLFIFITSISWSIFSYYLYIRNHKKKNKEYWINKLKRIGILSGIILFLSIYFFTKSTIWNLWIVYTINSFSILIPIILSIIIYKEHFDFKKAIAIVLTLLSLFFLK